MKQFLYYSVLELPHNEDNFQNNIILLDSRVKYEVFHLEIYKI